MNVFDDALYEKLAVRQLIDNWVLWRDAGFWERFRDCWWPEGKMMATWTQGTGDEFIGLGAGGPNPLAQGRVRPASWEQIIFEGNRLVQQMLEIDVPIICALNGPVVARRRGPARAAASAW